MGKIAYIFPGQGSQYVGMGAAAADEFAAAQDVFAAADGALGEKLSALCFHGPEEALRQTVNTQPAILATSIALWQAFQAGAPAPDYVAGHSLGEYTALVAAGSLAFADAVRTVRTRGQLMEEAVPSGEGAMAAVLGLAREQLADICRDASKVHGAVELANLNCPGQIVISGTAAGVAAVSEQAKTAGARRVLPLAVSGPFHSSLMAPAAERLGDVLNEVDVRDAHVPVVSNVSAEPLTRATDIRTALVRQVASPVLWEDSVNWMIAQGVDTFVEIGPGRVLSGLVRKIARRTTVYSVEDVQTLRETQEKLQKLQQGAEKVQ